MIPAGPGRVHLGVLDNPLCIGLVLAALTGYNSRQFFPPPPVGAQLRRHEDPRVKKLMSKKAAALFAVFSVGALLSLSGHAVTDKQKKEIEERIKPAGTLCLEGDSSCGAAVAAAGGKPKSGEEVFNGPCTMCHGTGVGGAPKVGDKAAWAPRIAQGVNTLHDHAIAGIRAMPPKGTCATCSDDEIKAAVDYMVSKSK